MNGLFVAMLSALLLKTCDVNTSGKIRENKDVSYEKERGNDETQWEGKKDTFSSQDNDHRGNKHKLKRSGEINKL